MSSEGKVLVVDDEPNIAEVVRLYLEHSNYEAIILPRGQEVLRTIINEKPNLVLLDIMLPDISGYELCEQIRKMEAPFHQTPIIFLTAKGESIDKLRGFNLGVDDYLVKPFDPNELIARIKAVLRRTIQSANWIVQHAEFIPQNLWKSAILSLIWTNTGSQSVGNGLS